MDILNYTVLNEIKNNANDRKLIPLSKVTKLNIPCYNGGFEAVHPSIVCIREKLNGYKFWMSFTPYTRSDSAVENPSIVASNDGVNWVVPNGLTNPVVAGITRPAYNRDSELVYVKGEGLRLYWGDSTGKAYYKASSDGVNWGNAVEVVGGMLSSNQSSLIRKSPTDWEAWGQSIGFSSDSQGTYKMSRFISKDGVNWVHSVPARTNLRSEIWHIGVLDDSVGYHFLACTYPKGRDNSVMDLVYGYSTNGVDVAFDSTPIITTTLDGFYDSKLYKCCMIPLTDNVYRIYISCKSVDQTWTMAYLDVKLNNPFSLTTSLYTPRKESFERLLFDNLEIRDTDNHYYGGNQIVIPEFNMYENKVLVIRNTHDQDLELYVDNMMRGANLWDALYENSVEGSTDAPRRLQKYIVGKGCTFFVDKKSLSCLGNIIAGNCTIRVKASVSPTSGNIIAKMISY